MNFKVKGLVLQRGVRGDYREYEHVVYSRFDMRNASRKNVT